MVERFPDAAVADVDGVRAWLAEIERTRDLTLPLGAAGGTPEAALAQRFVDALRDEMAGFREIVEAAAEAAALNAQQLDAIAGTTAEHSAVVEQTAAAIAEIDRGAAHVADTAEALRAQAGTMADSTSRYDSGIDQVLSRLEAVAAAVEAAAAFAGAMDSGSAQISNFLDRLRRIARQAGLLAINAAIEAAHLGERGRGFDIVASEVKKLAASTDESAANVKTIERELHDASAQVEKAINESASMVRGVARDLHVARERSGATREQVRELDRAIADVATIAAEQSASLSTVAGGVESIARHAQEVSTAADRAARLALGDALAGLQASIGTYRLGERRAHGAGAPVDVASLAPAARDAAAALRARVDADQRELLGGITAIAVSIARNSYEWRAIAEGLDSLRTQLEATTYAVDENAAGAEVAAGAAQRMRDSLDAMRDGFGASVEELQRTLERVVRVRETVEHAETYVAATTAAGDRAAKILDLIDAISSETTLLSLNAAIEAAHAGDAGAGFGVIADEIRRLAEGTSQATAEIAGVIAGVAEASGSMSRTTVDAVAQTAGVFDETTRMQGAVGELRTELNGTFQQATEVAGVVEQQLAALAQVRTATQMALRRVESDSVAATNGRRRRARDARDARARARRAPPARDRRRSDSHARARRRRPDGRGVRRGDRPRQPARGRLLRHELRRAERPADRAARAPVRRLEGPRERLRSAEVRDALRPRRRGRHRRDHRCVGSAPSRDQSDVRGRPERLLLRPLSRVPPQLDRRSRDRPRAQPHQALLRRRLEPALLARRPRRRRDELPRRTPYAIFRERNCILGRTDDRPWAIYTYARDTGIVYNDLSVAVYAQNRRIGTIRIIYDADVV